MSIEQVDIGDYVDGKQKRQDKNSEIDELSFRNSITNLINNPDLRCLLSFFLTKPTLMVIIIVQTKNSFHF